MHFDIQFHRFEMIRTLTAAALLAVQTGAAFAATATGTLQVQATVLNTCSVSTTPVVFSNVGLSVATSNGSVIVTCTNSDPVSVALDGGGSGDIAARELTHATLPTSLTYQLYSNPGLSTVWGDDVTGAALSTSGPSQTLTVYGQTTSTPVAAGSYSDAVQVTVTY
jgi:spore coat protein U-like protein